MYPLHIFYLQLLFIYKSITSLNVFIFFFCSILLVGVVNTKPVIILKNTRYMSPHTYTIIWNCVLFVFWYHCHCRFRSKWMHIVSLSREFCLFLFYSFSLAYLLNFLCLICSCFFFLSWFACQISFICVFMRFACWPVFRVHANIWIKYVQYYIPCLSVCWFCLSDL